MTNRTTLPHQNLIAYQVARELVVIVREAKIADAKLRDQALRAATSACLNIAEAGGHLHENDKRERATRNENGFRLRFSFWFFVFVDGVRFGFRWPRLANESAEQGIHPAGAGCPCVGNVGSATAPESSDIECRCRLTDLTAGDRIDPLLIRAPRPAGSLCDVQAGAAGSIESLLTDPGIGNTSLTHQRQQLPRSLICDELLVWKTKTVLAMFWFWCGAVRLKGDDRQSLFSRGGSRSV